MPTMVGGTDQTRQANKQNKLPTELNKHFDRSRDVTAFKIKHVFRNEFDSDRGCFQSLTSGDKSTRLVCLLAVSVCI